MDLSPSGWATAVLWLYGSFLILWALQWWLGRHIQGVGLLVFNRPGPAATIYFYLLAPGVILHELAHWVVAKLLFVPTKDLVLFQPQRSPNQSGRVTLGYVEIFKTDPVRQSFIGLAPLPVGVLVLLLLAALLNLSPAINEGMTGSKGMAQALILMPGEVFASLKQVVNLLWLYLVFAVSNGMLPSRPDRRPWLVGFVLPGSLFLILSLTGTLPPLPLDWQRGLRQLVGSLTWIFAFAALVNLLLATLIFSLELLVSRLKRRRVVYK